MNDHQISRRSLLLALPALRLAAQSEPRFSAEVKVVDVLATVRDKKGQLVNTLSQDDFAVSEDGRPQTIRYFSRETDLPLVVGLVVDTSGSQRSVIGEERDASNRFLDDVLRPDKDQAFVLHFDREVELLQDLTNSLEKLQHACDLLEVSRTGGSGSNRGGGYPGGGRGGRYPGGGGGGYPGGRGRRGGTSLFDAIYLAGNDVLAKQKGRKAVIVLSDGRDTGSKVTIGEAIEAAQRADTLAYSILFSGQESLPAPGFGGYGRRHGGMGRYPQSSQADGKKILQQLSRETGGGFFEVSKKETVDKVYGQIQAELRSQYSLGYTSDQPGGSVYRKISVTVKPKNLTVQARDGYYAAPR
jgi:VWFA-related protein